MGHLTNERPIIARCPRPSPRQKADDRIDGISGFSPDDCFVQRGWMERATPTNLSGRSDDSGSITARRLLAPFPLPSAFHSGLSIEFSPQDLPPINKSIPFEYRLQIYLCAGCPIEVDKLQEKTCCCLPMFLDHILYMCRYTTTCNYSRLAVAQTIDPTRYHRWPYGWYYCQRGTGP